MRRLVKYCVIFTLLVIVPLGLYVWYTSWRGQRMLDEIVAKLDAEGPWRWDDLVAARPATPDNEIAPKLIESVQARIPGMWSNSKAFEELPERSEVMLTPEQADRISEQMNRVKDLVIEARTVVDLPAGRMRLLPANDKDFWPNYNRVQKYREFAALLNYDAWHQAHIGDLDAAMRSSEAIWRAARSMDDELTMIPQLVRIAIEAITLGSLERTLAQGQPSLELLARMQKAVTETDPVAAFKSGVAGERAHVERVCRALASGETTLSQMGGVAPGAPPAAERVADIYLRVSLQEARAFMLKSLTETLEIMDLPGPERQPRLLEIDKELREAPGVAGLFGPAMNKFHHAFARGQAKRQCSIAALAAERFRRDTGRWPKTLDELQPKFLAETPLDPFTDQPLGYRHTRDGVVVYSVGPEGAFRGTYRDDAQPNADQSSYEFRLWNVPQRRQPPRAPRP